MGKKSTPAPPAQPDYAAVAQQQGQANLDAARTGAELTNTNQYTPYGNQIFTKDPNSDQWSSTINFSPEQQKLYDLQTQGQQSLGETAVSQIGNINSTLGTPMDLSGVPDRVNSITPGQYSQYSNSALPNSSYASSLYTGNTGAPVSSVNLGQYNGSTAAPVQNLDFSGLGNVPMAGDFAQQGKDVQDSLYRQATSTLDPQYQQQEDQLRTRLLNSGVQPGTEAYTNAFNDFNRQKNADYANARDRSISASGAEQSRLNSDALNARSQMLGQILSGGQFSNAANAQSIQQALAALGFNNQSALQSGEFANNAGNQTFQQGMAATGFNNSVGADRAGFENAAAQQNADNLYRTTSGNNAAQAQGFNDQLTAGNFQNTQRGAGLDEAAYLRSLPLNEYNSLMTGSQVTNPQFRATGQVQGPAAAPVFAGAQAQGQSAMDLYNAQMAARNSTMGGLGSLLGTLGGAAISKYSDRRLKSNIRQIGKLKNSGVPYYRYDIFGSSETGVMADEIKSAYPHAVSTASNGYEQVDYSQITEPVEFN